MPVASGVVNRFDSVMTSLCGLPLRVLDVEEALAAGAAGLVDHHHRLLHQVVLGDDALDGARHLVGAAAGTGRHDDLDRPRRLPCRLRNGNGGRAQRDRGAERPRIQWSQHGRFLVCLVGSAGRRFDREQ